MSIKEMKIGVVYIVTQASKTGDFLVGERIKLLPDGDLMHLDLGAWMEAEDLEDATEDMLVEIDKTWLTKKQNLLKEELEFLNSII